MRFLRVLRLGLVDLRRIRQRLGAEIARDQLRSSASASSPSMVESVRM
jgi:hypothetical protein